LPFLRFSRDKRGVESFALVHTTTNRRGKVKPRVLYWFRTPPDIKVGRQPFDPAVRRALEAQNPDIAFDWRAIVETPIPSADADKWRERRRAERAAKYAAAAEESAETVSGEIEIEVEAGTDAEVEEIVAAPSEAAVLASDSAEPLNIAPPAQSSPRSNDPNRKRRRRRSGGRGRGGNAPGGAAPSSPSGSEPSGE
jgi:hypothetical protein